MSGHKRKCREPGAPDAGCTSYLSLYRQVLLPCMFIMKLQYLQPRVCAEPSLGYGITAFAKSPLLQGGKTSCLSCLLQKPC